MTGVAVFVWVLFAVALALALVGPKRWFWAVRAPQLKHPEAGEPSETGYGVAVVANWIGVVILLILAIAMTAMASSAYSADDVRSAADDIAQGVDDYQSDTLLGPSIEGIADDRGYGGKLQIDSVSGSGERYQISNRKGDHPVCLTVVSHSGGVGADIVKDTTYRGKVADGPCPTG